MSAATRFIGPSVAFAVLVLMGSGIYLKIRGNSGAEGESGESRGDLPEVSATSTFATNVAIPVAGAEVVLDTLVISVTAAGEAAAWLQSKVLAEVDGIARRIPVRENQLVRSGRLLMVLDTIDLALDLREAQAGLAQAEARYREITLFDDARTVGDWIVLEPRIERAGVPEVQQVDDLRVELPAPGRTTRPPSSPMAR